MSGNGGQPLGAEVISCTTTRNQILSTICELGRGPQALNEIEAPANTGFQSWETSRRGSS